MIIYRCDVCRYEEIATDGIKGEAIFPELFIVVQTDDKQMHVCSKICADRLTHVNPETGHNYDA